MCDRFPDKVEHLSAQVAANAAQLHRWAHPACTTIGAYPCGDHHHIGHHPAGSGAQCKREHTVTYRPRPTR